MTQYRAVWANGITVRWRALSWAEYRRFQTELQTRPMGVGVLANVYRAVLVEGPTIDKVPAGIADFVAKHVLEKNPFAGDYKSVKWSIDRSREALASQYLLSAKAMVSHLFHYSFEEIDKWDAETFFLRLAQAEFIAGRALEPEAPRSEKEENQKQKKPKKALSERQAEAIRRVQERDR